MKTEWDYSELADAYLKRPDYASEAVEELISCAGVTSEDSICDVGAGVGHLTIEFAKRGLDVVAVEPNDAMRANGTKRTAHFPNVRWVEGTGEDTRQATGAFKLVTFGSSFNVTDRQKALLETARILTARGWFACMWNHRDLADPIQEGIEEIIKRHITDYSYGTRREDQTRVIEASKLFSSVQRIERRVIHAQLKEECVEAWRSHATLQRQAGEKFFNIVREIEQYVMALPGESIEIPYTTRIWAAQLLRSY